MRHILVVCYNLSLLILGTVLFITILAGTPKNTIFYNGSLSAEYFTPAFSTNVDSARLLHLFGEPRLTMIILVGIGLLLHSIFLYRLLKFRKKTKKIITNYFTYWLVLFIPYLLLLIFVI